VNFDKAEGGCFNYGYKLKMTIVNLVRLSDLKLKVSAIEALENINRIDRPVLCSLDPKLCVWGIDSNLQYLTKEIANETDTIVQMCSRNEHLKTSDQFNSSRHIENVKFVRLYQQDIKQLTNENSSIEVTEVPAVVIRHENGNLEELNYFKTHRYRHPDKEVVNVFDKTFTYPKIPSKLLGDEFQFVFTPNSYRVVTQFNSPLNELRRLNVTLNHLYVQYDDVSEYLINPINEIRPDSDYHLPEKYRGISLLDELAVFADNWYRQNNKTGNKGLKDDLPKELVQGNKKAAAAAYFLSQAPKGKTGSDSSISTRCQFPYLVKALEMHVETNSTSRHQNKAVFNYLLDQGFSEDNAKYGELLSRPMKKV
tara:strand:+ start:2033 stop:3133 length:1101 start_codon:yes stop_codon:yes gene_type:complete